MYQPSREAAALRTKYETEISPLIRESNYELVAIAMRSARMCTFGVKIEIMAKTHNGFGLLAAADALERVLREGHQRKIKFYGFEF